MFSSRDGRVVFKSSAYQNWTCFFDIKSGFLLHLILLAIIGAVYGTAVVFVYERFDMDTEILADVVSNHGVFVYFILGFYVNAALGATQSTIKTFRAAQGGYAGLFFKLRMYLLEDESELPQIRDLVFAAAWSSFGTISSSCLKDIALIRVQELLPGDVDKDLLIAIGNGKPLGLPVSYRMLLMAAGKFQTAVERAGNQKGLNEIVLQQQRSEIQDELLVLRRAFAIINDARGDGHQMHVAYTQTVAVVTFCYLVLLPWGRAGFFGYYTIFLCALEVMGIGGVYWLGSSMFQPLEGHTAINLRAFMAEVEGSFARWAPREQVDIVQAL